MKREILKKKGMIIVLALSLSANFIFFATEYVIKKKIGGIVISSGSDLLSDKGYSLSCELYETYKDGWNNQSPKKIVFFEDKLNFLFNGNVGLGYVPYRCAEEGWLYVSLIENAIKRNDEKLISKIQNLFDDHILNDSIESIVQAVNGIVAIRLYEVTKNNKYHFFADKVFNWLLKNYTEENGIVYGSIDLPAVDGYGMNVPFLTIYSKVFGVPHAYKMAVNQIECWVKWGGVNAKTGIPYMAVSTKTPNLPAGYCNWGRGTAWWVIALCYIDKDDLSIDACEIVRPIDTSLKTIWESYHSFPQLLQQSGGLDLSATLPILYYLRNVNQIDISAEDIFMISKYFSKGCLNGSSGPNSGLLLSPYQGANPLSDAFLLKIINDFF